MQSFRKIDELIGLVPADVTRALSAVDRGLGRQNSFRNQNPGALATLIAVARVQSTEASNAIEDIVAPSNRIRELMDEKTTPADRSEAEIAGYRHVLDQIHASARDIPFKRSVVEQFHRDLYRYTPVRAGRFKIGPNDVKEYEPDGVTVRRVRFSPVSVAETPTAMDELHRRFDHEWHREHHHELLILGAYVFDFLMIHPFQDGNGRISRLLGLLLLYQSGYEVGRYVSIEKLINDTRQTYYDSLEASTAGWHEGTHDLWPWLRYLTGILVAASKDFEDRVKSISRRGAKTTLVRSFVRGLTKDVFTFSEVRTACPGVSEPQIRKVLRQMKVDRLVTSEGVGMSARWIRLSTDFEP